jgi:hypothetical protein
MDLVSLNEDFSISKAIEQEQNGSLTSGDSLMRVGTPPTFHTDVRAGLDGVFHLYEASIARIIPEKIVTYSDFWPT